MKKEILPKIMEFLIAIESGKAKKFVLFLRGGKLTNKEVINEKILLYSCTPV